MAALSFISFLPKSLSLFGKLSRLASGALSSAKLVAPWAAENWKTQGEPVSLKSLKQRATEGDAQGFVNALASVSGVSAINALVDHSSSLMESACLAPAGSERMIEALINKSSALAHKTIIQASGRALAPIELCVESGRWEGAIALASQLPNDHLSLALFGQALGSLGAGHQKRLHGLEAKAAAYETLAEWGNGLEAEAEAAAYAYETLAEWERARRFLDRFEDCFIESDRSWIHAAMPHAPLARWLHKYGCDPNTQTSWADREQTALHKAARVFDASFCEELIAMRARVEALDNEAQTPLKALGRSLQEFF